jgi:hypothetical protein
LVLFEVYVKWSKLDKSQQAQWIQSSDQAGNSSVAMLEQYLYMLFLCTFEFFFWHFGIWIGSMSLLQRRLSLKELERLSLGIILSSFGKLLLIAMAIWNFSDLEHSWLINMIVLASNSVALSGTAF